MEYERMLDKDHKPSEKEIVDYLGGKVGEAWVEIVSFLRTSYNFSPELDCGGTKYGWSIRYRKSGKSLCTLYPERGAFTVLVILGKREVEQVEEHMNEFSMRFVDSFKSAKQFHDGRWPGRRRRNRETREVI